MDENKALKIHYLKVLIELDLYPKVRCLSEGTIIPNIEEAKNDTIIRFIETLPSIYKEVDGYKSIIYAMIQELERKDKEVKER